MIERGFWVTVQPGASEIALWEHIALMAAEHGCEILSDRGVQYGSSIGRDILVELKGEPDSIKKIEARLYLNI